MGRDSDTAIYKRSASKHAARAKQSLGWWKGTRIHRLHVSDHRDTRYAACGQVSNAIEHEEGRTMLLIIILLVLIFGFGYGGYRVGPGYGYYGGGGISLILVIVLILLLLKVI
jgi:hypothetical protein